VLNEHIRNFIFYTLGFKQANQQIDFSILLSNASDCLTKLHILEGIYKNKNPQLLFTDNFLKGERSVGAHSILLILHE